MKLTKASTIAKMAEMDLSTLNEHIHSTIEEHPFSDFVNTHISLMDGLEDYLLTDSGLALVLLGLDTPVGRAFRQTYIERHLGLTGKGGQL
jgi:hypothetical protein